VVLVVGVEVRPVMLTARLDEHADRTRPPSAASRCWAGRLR
jgi:hypothetical protein